MVDRDALFEIGGRITCEAPLRYERWKSNFVGEGDRVAIAAKPPGLATPLTEEVVEDGLVSFGMPACTNLLLSLRSVSERYDRVLDSLGWVVMARPDSRRPSAYMKLDAFFCKTGL